MLNKWTFGRGLITLFRRTERGLQLAYSGRQLLFFPRCPIPLCTNLFDITVCSAEALPLRCTVVEGDVLAANGCSKHAISTMYGRRGQAKDRLTR
jgi:hypothetical protein